MPGGYYSQFVKGKYRDGTDGGWPMKSPNPLVCPETVNAFESLSARAVGLELAGVEPLGARASSSPTVLKLAGASYSEHS